MFAMSALVGTPVVAAPVRATKAVRATRTVAMAKPAPKKGAKKKVSKGEGGKKKKKIIPRIAMSLTVTMAGAVAAG